jgi:hypothetical protein
MFEEKSFSVSPGKKVTSRFSGNGNRGTDGAGSFLKEGEITGCQLVPRGSNYVYLVSLEWRGENALAVYKPRQGEAPLWDFPDGTLYKRELSAYLVSETLGWNLVPTTIIREGPHGIGMLQRFVNIRRETDYPGLFNKNIPVFKRIAAFDWLVNNADRKVGHCLEDNDGRVWIIDHGLTFHVEPKLRTVIWDFSGQPVPGKLLADLERLSDELESDSDLATAITELLSAREIQALRRRLKGILDHPVFPDSFGSRRRTPWPPF